MLIGQQVIYTTDNYTTQGVLSEQLEFGYVIQTANGELVCDFAKPAESSLESLRDLQIQTLRYHRFSVLSDGFVAFVDCMGADQDIVDAARVSYQKGTIRVSSDRGLIRYLMRHRHSTPFEMVELKFLVRVPMDCWRQWIRHRTANVNEYSTRYSEAIDSMDKVGTWRVQSKSNKQGSESLESRVQWPEGFEITEGSPKEWYLVERGKDIVERFNKEQFPEQPTPEDYLSRVESRFHEQATVIYQERLQANVAREQARKDLPLSNYTEAYWKIDLHNLFHFLGLRMDSHAQWEIRQYANIIGEIIKMLFPLAWEAFEDYRLNGMFLSSLEQQVIRDPQSLESIITNKRERDECLSKMRRLGIECPF